LPPQSAPFIAFPYSPPSNGSARAPPSSALILSPLAVNEALLALLFLAGRTVFRARNHLWLHPFCSFTFSSRWLFPRQFFRLHPGNKLSGISQYLELPSPGLPGGFWVGEKNLPLLPAHRKFVAPRSRAAATVSLPWEFPAGFLALPRVFFCNTPSSFHRQRAAVVFVRRLPEPGPLPRVLPHTPLQQPCRLLFPHCPVRFKLRYFLPFLSRVCPPLSPVVLIRGRGRPMPHALGSQIELFSAPD